MQKIALLDWDGTLSRGFTVTRWVAFLAAERILGKSILNVLDQVFHQYEEKRISHDELAKRTADAVAMSLRGKPVKTVAASTRLFVVADKSQLFGFTLDACAFFKRTHFKVYVISGAPLEVLDCYRVLLPLPVELHCLAFMK